MWSGMLADRWPGEIRLERVTHPETDTIRWAKTLPSIEVTSDEDALLRLRIMRFGRGAVTELRAALVGARWWKVEIDLRGDPERMFDLAALSFGDSKDAVEIRQGDKASRCDLVASEQPSLQVEKVLIDSKTDSTVWMIGGDNQPERLRSSNVSRSAAAGV